MLSESVVKDELEASGLGNPVDGGAIHRDGQSVPASRQVCVCVLGRVLSHPSETS